jgi:hypothetical protein
LGIEGVLGRFGILLYSSTREGMMYRKLVSLIGLVVVLSPVVVAQQGMSQGAYPAPRYPEFKKNYSDEELLAIARVVVRKPALGPGRECSMQS